MDQMPGKEYESGMPKNNEEDTIDLWECLAVVYKWRWLIVLITLGCTIISGIINFYVIKPIYEAKAVVSLDQAISENTLYQDSVRLLTASKISVAPDINTYVTMVKDDEVLNRTLETMGERATGLDSNTLKEMVSVQPIKDTNRIEIKVLGIDPQITADIANCLGKEFLSYQSSINKEKTKKIEEIIKNQLSYEEKNINDLTVEFQQLLDSEEEARIKQLNIESVASHLRDTRDRFNLLKDELIQLQISQEIFEQIPGELSRASIPSSPIKPNRTVNVMVASVIGVMFAVLLAFILEFVRTRKPFGINKVDAKSTYGYGGHDEV